MSKQYPHTDTIDTPQEQVYLDQDLWYFDTESGETVGPFRYKSEAETNLTRFLSQLKDQLGVES